MTLKSIPIDRVKKYTLQDLGSPVQSAGGLIRTKTRPPRARNSASSLLLDQTELFSESSASWSTYTYYWLQLFGKLRNSWCFQSDFTGEEIVL